MATQDFEDEIKDLKVKNTELVQKVQFWKMKSAQLENDKLDLMKENNDLRLKISRLRSGGAAQARALDGALQASSEEALSHLVQASTAVARSLELAKSYMRERQVLEAASPRWSMIGGTPTKEKVHKVAPMLMGGRSIQPYVTLDRMDLNSSNLSVPPNTNPNRNVTERVLPLPMHILHDVYIPLQRLDPSEFRQLAGDDEEQVDAETSNQDSGDNEMDEEAVEEPQQDGIEEGEEQEFNNSRELNAVHEESETEPTEQTPPPMRRFSLDPLEGPSWLLDLPRRKNRERPNLEPDSTTEPVAATPPPDSDDAQKENIPLPEEDSRAFTPTVRRRRAPPAAASPAAPPAPPPLSPLPDALARRRNSLKNRNSGRVLKVLLPKMEWGTPPVTPRGGRRASYEAPSPSGATDTALTVLEQNLTTERPPSSDVLLITSESSLCPDQSSGEPPRKRRGGRGGSADGPSGGESDSGGEQGGRTRRPRKEVTYKEKPLNRKLRR